MELHSSTRFPVTPLTFFQSNSSKLLRLSATSYSFVSSCLTKSVTFEFHAPYRAHKLPINVNSYNSSKHNEKNINPLKESSRNVMVGDISYRYNYLTIHTKSWMDKLVTYDNNWNNLWLQWYSMLIGHPSSNMHFTLILYLGKFRKMRQHPR